MVLDPPPYNILGVKIEWMFLFVLIVLGIILIKNRNILKPNKRKFILFLALFIFLSFMPILDHSYLSEITSLFQFFITFLSYVGLYDYTTSCSFSFLDYSYSFSFLGYYGKSLEALTRFIPFLAIISYTFSCLMISVYDKFKIKKIK